MRRRLLAAYVAPGGGPLPSGHPAALPWGPNPTARLFAAYVAPGGGPLPSGHPAALPWGPNPTA